MWSSCVWALVALFAIVVPVRADVILTSTNLNDALKNLERVQQQIAAAPAGKKADAQCQLGLEAEALAELMSDEVAAHGMDQKALLDLALQRTKEMGIGIAYSREKRKFMYDNAAFREAIEDDPKGPRAVDARFKVLEGEFFRSDGTNAAEIAASVERKRAFLRDSPKYQAAVEVHMMLAVDYRDLTRLAQASNDTAAFARYRDLARAELRLIPRQYPGTEQAKIATEMLKRFNEQFR